VTVLRLPPAEHVVALYQLTPPSHTVVMGFGVEWSRDVQRRAVTGAPRSASVIGQTKTSLAVFDQHLTPSYAFLLTVLPVRM
jgi:hypothetical protein